jgi:predicted lipoprotein with Yx(FWY)xxD motif
VRVRTRLLPSLAAAALLLAACEGADEATSPGQEDGVEELDPGATDDTDGDTDADAGTDGDADTDADAGTDGDADTDDATDDPTDDPVAAGEVVLEAQESDLGTHLVDGDGATLYLSVSDGEDQSTCTSACVQLWQPVLVDGEPTAGDGVQEDLVGTFEREDDLGTQVTYDGMPLYRFVSDDEPGDTNGHGLADAWFAVDVEGGAIGGAEIVGPPPEEDEAEAESTDEDEDDEDDEDE